MKIKIFDFADILKKKQDATNDISAELKFSKHAQIGWLQKYKIFLQVKVNV